MGGRSKSMLPANAVVAAADMAAAFNSLRMEPRFS